MHSIRLHGPWSLRIEQGPDVRVDVPAELTPKVASGETVQLQRRFNCPTGLVASDRVRIELAYTGELLDFTCNGHFVDVETSQDEPLAVDVGPLLKPGNELTLTIRRSGDEELTLASCVLVIESC
jgi:hypothetical protein